MKTKRLLTLFFILSAFRLSATVIPVPGTYSDIQSALNASVTGDTIAVAPGTYFENINFKGKNVVLTSLFYLNSDINYITTTIINGSTPINADTASCVIFCSGETSNAVLQGFTITGGTGTAWTDEHGAGIYREGGGILVALSSPTIRHNIITGNEAVNSTGINGAGGGGIRIGDGNPTFINNVVIYNQGKYGPGIVLNYTGCLVKNNIIASNSGGGSYSGGSGIWVNNNNGSLPKVIENNTIVYNTSTLSGGTGGIFCMNASNVIIRNNIVRNNYPALQVKKSSSTLQVNCNNIQGGYVGGTNIIDSDPLFSAQNYLLSEGSPCTDAGDSDPIYNDIEDSNSPGNALPPSKGLLRNDLGAYGGQTASVFPSFQTQTSIKFNSNQEHSISIYPNPASERIIVDLTNSKLSRNALISLINIQGQIVIQKNANMPIQELSVVNPVSGIYLLKITDGEICEIFRVVIE